MKSFFTFAVLQFTSYLIVTINMRAIAHQHYAEAVITDALTCALSWTIVKRISEAKDNAGFVGLILGGSCAAVVGIWLTRAWG